MTASREQLFKYSSTKTCRAGVEQMSALGNVGHRETYCEFILLCQQEQYEFSMNSPTVVCYILRKP